MKVDVGLRYGRLIVIDLINDKTNKRAMCLCDCGNVTFPQRTRLKSGATQSCGCKRSDDLRSRITKHDLSRTVEYRAFMKIFYACSNPNHKLYKFFGARGVKCLYKDVTHLIEDIGRSPPGFSSIELINKSEHFKPGNCRWTKTGKHLPEPVQLKVWIADGVVFNSAKEVASHYGISLSTVYNRCNGYTWQGNEYGPWPGWRSEFKQTNEAETA